VADRNPGSLRDITRQLRTGEISAGELTESALARHTEHGHRLHAYKHFDAERAREAAGLADARLARADAPPLCGIPISVKDIYGVAGMPTFAGSARQLPAMPWSQDAWLVTRLRAAGAVIVGKTHTVEFALAASASTRTGVRLGIRGTRTSHEFRAGPRAAPESASGRGPRWWPWARTRVARSGLCSSPKCTSGGAGRARTSGQALPSIEGFLSNPRRQTSISEKWSYGRRLYQSDRSGKVRVADVFKEERSATAK
jgi:hypothetical protein